MKRCKPKPPSSGWAERERVRERERERNAARGLPVGPLVVPRGGKPVPVVVAVGLPRGRQCEGGGGWVGSIMLMCRKQSSRRTLPTMPLTCVEIKIRTLAK